MKHGNFTHGSLTELIKARHFDWVNPDVTDKRFPTPNRLWNDYEEFHFGENVSSEGVVKQIQAKGYEPANSHELLLWDRWNGKDAVVALGSVGRVGGNRFVLLLHASGSRWHLFLRWLVGDLPASYCFLAVRKSGS